MNITLHEATEQVRAMLDAMDPETGELPPEYDSARALVETRAAACASYIMETERQAQYVRSYARELHARAQSAMRRTERLRRYLAEHMATAGVSRITDERSLVSATLQAARDVSVDVFAPEQVPRAYMREVPARLEPDKEAIRRALAESVDVPGARLVRHDRLTIR